MRVDNSQLVQGELLKTMIHRRDPEPPQLSLADSILAAIERDPIAKEEYETMRQEAATLNAEIEKFNQECIRFYQATGLIVARLSSGQITPSQALTDLDQL